MSPGITPQGILITMKTKLALYVSASLFVFVVIGWMAQHIVLLHAHVRTAGYGPEVTLAGYTAGLFAGGVAAVIVFIALLMLDNQPPRN
jgi:hypothetical protein